MLQLNLHLFQNLSYTLPLFKEFIKVNLKNKILTIKTQIFFKYFLGIALNHKTKQNISTIKVKYEQLRS
jgi:hypothetical protein